MRRFAGQQHVTIGNRHVKTIRSRPISQGNIILPVTRRPAFETEMPKTNTATTENNFIVAQVAFARLPIQEETAMFQCRFGASLADQAEHEKDGKESWQNQQDGPDDSAYFSGLSGPATGSGSIVPASISLRSLPPNIHATMPTGGTNDQAKNSENEN